MKKVVSLLRFSLSSPLLYLVAANTYWSTIVTLSDAWHVYEKEQWLWLPSWNKKISIYINVLIQGGIHNFPDWHCKNRKTHHKARWLLSPLSGSLPHVDTGPTISFIFWTFPGSPFLSVCQAHLCDSACISSMITNRRPFSFNFIFGIARSHRVPNQGSTVGGGWQPFFFLPETAGWGRKSDTARSWKSPQVTYTTPNKRVWKLSTSTQLRATWHTDSLDMEVLPSTGASPYLNCCIDGCTSPESFGYHLVHLWNSVLSVLHLYLQVSFLEMNIWNYYVRP
jgi:hypothetical protein